MPICECCHKEGGARRCGRCRESWYCGTACQRKAWKAGHKHKCVKADQDKAMAATGGAAKQAATASGEECVICMDVLKNPQTMPCGHRFCRVCVDGMRANGVGKEQVCPLCRGPMPDAEGVYLQAAKLLTRFNRVLEAESQPPWVEEVRSKAAALCREALSIDPGHAAAHYGLGVILQGGGADDRAFSAFQAAAAADPQFAPAHYNIGLVLERRKDFAGAEAAYRRAIAIEGGGPPELYNRLGCVLGENCEYAAAAAAFVQALQIRPSYTDAKHNLAQTLEAMHGAQTW
jgi:Flp pilus assembly protein TadD